LPPSVVARVASANPAIKAPSLLMVSSFFSRAQRPRHRQRD
jgi:hypothetical protein